MSNKQILENAYPFGSYLMYKVPVSELELDYEYQRLSTKTVAGLVKRWNGEKCDPLLVNYRREEDKFFVIDGGHRLNAAKILQLELLPCRILVGKTRQEEAEIFARQNEDVAQLKVYDRWKAAIVAQNQAACELKELFDSFELKVVRNPYQTLASVRCLSLCWEMARNNNLPALKWILKVIEDAGWHNVEGAYNQSVVYALGVAYNSFAEDPLSYKILVNILKATSPSILKATACGEFPHASYRGAMSSYVNKRLRQDLIITKAFNSIPHEINKEA